MNKYLLTILLFLPTVAFSQAGVDTVSIQESGGDYTTVFLFEAGENRDLVSADTAIVAVIEGSWTTAEAVPAAINFSGWTCDETRGVKVVTVGESRHQGVFDTTSGYYWATDQGYNAVLILQTSEAGITFDGLQIFMNGTVPNNDWGIHAANQLGYTKILNNIIVSYETAAQTGIVWDQSNHPGGVIANNLVYMSDNVASVGISIDEIDTLSNGLIIANNTIVNPSGTRNGTAIRLDCQARTFAGGNIITVVNNVFINAGLSWAQYRILEVGSDTIAAGSILYNSWDTANLITMYSNGFYDTTGSDNNLRNQTFTFVDSSNGDFHLASGDAGAQDLGLSLYDTTGGPLTDIDDEPRGDIYWDRGYDELFKTATDTVWIWEDTSTATGVGYVNDSCPEDACYEDLQAAETAHQSDLKTDDSARLFLIGGAWSSADVTTTFDGSTTDAVRNITVETTGDARHEGTYSTSHYRIEASGNNGIVLSDEFITIDGVQVYLTGAYRGIRVSGADNATVKNCISRGAGVAGAAQYGIFMGTDCLVYNNIIYDWSVRGVYALSGTDIYNNTIVNCAQAVSGGYTDINVWNNIIWGCPDFQSGDDIGSGGYNATDSTSFTYDDCGSCGTGDLTEIDDPFVDTSANNFLITAGSDVVDIGAGGSLVFTTDILGVSRPQGTLWDIGAHEFPEAAAGGGFIGGQIVMTDPLYYILIKGMPLLW